MSHKNIKTPVKGYKVFRLESGNLVCRGFRFGTKKQVLNKVFINKSESGFYREPVLCSTGFHFCKKLHHCFNYYSNVPIDLKGFAVCEVEGHRQITTNSGNKVAAGELKITRILSAKEIKELMRPKNTKIGVISEKQIEVPIFVEYNFFNQRNQYYIKVDGRYHTVPRDYARKENIGALVTVKVTKEIVEATRFYYDSCCTFKYRTNTKVKFL